jgi:hypothetical protein
MNEETVAAFCLLSVFTGEELLGNLNNARHLGDGVDTLLDSVGVVGTGSVQDVLVDSSFQETAQLESQAYELQQRTALAAEAKQVLDSTTPDIWETVSIRCWTALVWSARAAFRMSLCFWTQETAQLESQAYELQQRTALAAEAKQVLDSWVRYENQVKLRDRVFLPWKQRRAAW